MADIMRDKDGFTVDAAILADAFGVAAKDVPSLMRSGTITSRSETGVDADAGRWRLTFFHEGKVFRLTVDDTGQILGRARFDASRRADTEPRKGVR